MNELNKSSKSGKAFSEEVIQWWIKWVRIHNKKTISEEEAESELHHLQSFITDLKVLYNDKRIKK